jgi:muconate cycloisomerase
MTIRDVEFYLVEIGLDGEEAPLRSVLARLATDAGLEGWGEAQLEWRVSEFGPRRDVLLPILAGRSVFDVEELVELGALQPPPLRAALEMASWDLVGRTVGQPLCHLFGGAYRRRIPVSVRLAGPSLVALARELADQGFHSQIITSSARPEQDRKALAAVREAVGDRIELRFDAVAGYDMDVARDLCAELEPDPPQLLLDPLRSMDLDQIASLHRQTSVPLGVWRSIRRPADVLALVRCGAALYVAIDLQLVGGIGPARQCAAIAQAAGLSASVLCGPSVGIGAAAMLQLAASTPAFSSCNECVYHRLQDDVLTRPLEIVDGMISLPQGPGLGVEVDRRKVERYQVS